MFYFSKILESIIFVQKIIESLFYKFVIFILKISQHFFFMNIKNILNKIKISKNI